MPRELFPEIVLPVVRGVHAIAWTVYSVLPLRLSLQGTRQHLDNFIPQLLVICSNKCRRIYRILLAMIVHKPVPERPGRSEPRVRKRRPIKACQCRKARIQRNR